MALDTKACDTLKAKTLDDWKTVLGSTQQGVQAHILGEAPFQGHLAVEQFGPVMFRRFSSTPVRYVRSDNDIRRSPGESFGVTLTLTGRAIIRQRDREVTQAIGDIVLLDNSLPFEYVLPEGDDQIVLDIPHILLRERLPNIDNFACELLSGRSTFGRLVGNMLSDLTAEDHCVDEHVAARLGSTLVELIAIAMETELSARKGHDVRGATLDRVKAYVLDRLDDPELNIDSIAYANNLSSRSLHRMFAESGTTMMRWLWQQRLSASYKALSAGKAGKVSEVAMMYGFSSFSHFSRSFKRAFGVLPQDVLRAS